MTKIKQIYEKKYRLLLWIPIILFVLSIAQIGYQQYTTGSFAEKDLSLKGGYFVKIPYELDQDANQYAVDLEAKLIEKLNRDVEVTTITTLGRVDAIQIETEIFDDVGTINQHIVDITGIKQEQFLSQGIVNASLGESFFKETFRAIVIAFIVMAIVVFVYFRNFGPSMAIVTAALFDIVMTMAVFNLMGYKLSTAAISAFLMLIGYSVDTDILLSTKVLKQKKSTDINENIYAAMRTGLTMTITTIGALTVAFFVANSFVIQQIMTVLLIGLTIDIMNTWIMNVSILRMYLERKK